VKILYIIYVQNLIEKSAGERILTTDQLCWSYDQKSSVLMFYWDTKYMTWVQSLLTAHH